MSIQDFRILSPILILAGASILLLLEISVRRNHRLAFYLTTAALIAAMAASLAMIDLPTKTIGSLLVTDSFGFFYSAMLIAAGLIVTLLSYSYLRSLPEQMEEYYVLILLSVLGALILVIANHFASLFLGLELLSVSLYALTGYLVKSRDRSIEAGAKYLILAAASAAFLLFGMALVFYETGQLGFAGIGDFFARVETLSLITITGLGLLIAGIGFKLALVPFHMWTPDIYEGAPAPVGALVATVSKGAVVGMLLRIYTAVDGYQFPSLVLLFALFAAASMLGGNLLALQQTNVKRILAYSSIAHLGYLIVAFLSGGSLAVGATTFYLIAYFITILGAFGVVTYLSTGDREAEQLADYRSLFWRQPGVAIIFTAIILSLAGIPLTAGFIGKFYIAAAGAQEGLWGLLFVLVIASVIGLYYYLRIIVAMFSREEEPVMVRFRWFSGVGLVLVILAVALIWLGVFPQGMLTMIEAWAPK